MTFRDLARTGSVNVHFIAKTNNGFPGNKEFPAGLHTNKWTARAAVGVIAAIVFQFAAVTWTVGGPHSSCYDNRNAVYKYLVLHRLGNDARDLVAATEMPIMRRNETFNGVALQRDRLHVISRLSYLS